MSHMELIARLGIYGDVRELEKANPGLEVRYSDTVVYVYDDDNRIALTAPLRNGRPGQWESFDWYDAWDDFMKLGIKD